MAFSSLYPGVSMSAGNAIERSMPVLAHSFLRQSTSPLTAYLLGE